MFKAIKLAVVAVLLLGFSGCVTYDASRNPGAAVSSVGGVQRLQAWGIRVYPRTVISIINGTAGPIEVEGRGIEPQFLRPGERREIIFYGATSGGDEVAYYAYGVTRKGLRTGAVDVEIFRLARRGERNEVWVIRRLRPPRK